MFFVKPDVEIKDYKCIAADRTIRETTDAEIDAQIEAERNRNSRTVEVTDRAAQNGDTAPISITKALPTALPLKAERPKSRI